MTPAIKVLVVDDDLMICEVLQEVLKTKGFQALVASDAQAGLDLARRYLPDVMLLDVMMPGINGFDICRRLKADAKTSGIKVIMVTALGRVSDVELAFQVGAVDYIHKPFENQRLLEKIAKAAGAAPGGPGPPRIS